MDARRFFLSFVFSFFRGPPCRVSSQSSTISEKKKSTVKARTNIQHTLPPRIGSGDCFFFIVVVVVVVVAVVVALWLILIAADRRTEDTPLFFFVFFFLDPTK